MKAERNTNFFQILIYGAMLLGLVLSGVMATILSRCTDGDLHSQTLFRLSLAELGILLAVLVGVVLVFRRFRSQSLDGLNVDNLTGFINRHAFSQVFEQALQDTRRSLEPLSVLIVDIDRFRMINEKHGHQVGDAILTMLSKSILTALRASDITCRWDGNQFLIVLKDCPAKDGCRVAHKMLEKIRQQQLVVGEKTIGVTASIGIAQMVSGDNTQALIARAETGLYSSRDNGRDTYAIGYDWILIDYSYDPIF